jgi:hypothetical protein
MKAFARTLLLRTSFLAEHCRSRCRSWLHIGVVVLVDGVPQVLPLLRQEHAVPRTPVIDPSVVLVSAVIKIEIFFSNSFWTMNHFSYVVLFLLKFFQ